MQGAKPKICFRKNENEFREISRSKTKFGGRQARFAKVEGVGSDGDFEQRRQVWGQWWGNMTSFWERGNTDRFKDQWPIWQEKEKRWTNTNPASKTKGGSRKEVETEQGKKKRKSVMFDCLETNGNGQ